MPLLELGRAFLRNGTAAFVSTLTAAFLGLSLAATPALGGEVQLSKAEEGPEQARAFLQSFGDRAVATLADAGMDQAQRREAFRGLIRSGFEVDTIGRLVLGRHWKTASEAQRSEFSRLFEDYVVVTTVKRLSGYAGEVLTVGAARPATQNGLVTVNSSIERNAGADIVLDWRLRYHEGSWRVIDVVVEGVSMLQTQRAEFDAVIRNNGAGIDGLLSKLRSIVQA